MAKRLEEGEYRPPNKTMCDDVELPIDMPAEGFPGQSRLFTAMRTHRGQVVHYAISQQWRANSSSEWRNVFRIDTSHGSIHKHRFKNDGTDTKELIETLPKNGRARVHESYTESYDDVHNGVDRRLRGWLQ